MTDHALADEFGISMQHAHAIVRNHRWKGHAHAN